MGTLKLYNLNFVTHTFRCIVFLLEQQKHFTRVTQLLNFLIYAYPCFSPADEGMTEGDRNYGFFHIYLSFYVVILSLSSFLIQGSNMTEKDTIRFLGHSCFLECHYLLWKFETSSGSNEVWPLRAVSTSAHSVVNLTSLHFTYVSLNYSTF